MPAEKRKIAFFLSGLAGGGSQRRLLTLAAGMAERDFAIDIVVPRTQGPFAAALPAAARLVPLASPLGHLPGIAGRRALWVFAAESALADYLRRETPAALLASSNPANLTAIRARNRAGTRTRVVATVNVQLSAAARGYGLRGRVLRSLARRYYPQADALIAISRGVADDLQRTVPLASDRIRVVYNPVDSTAIRHRAQEPVHHPWLAPGAPPLLLAVGKLKAQKDFPTLLRAFARVREGSAARLAILGEGEERRSLERLATRLGLAGALLLPGFVVNPFVWMARADVFVLSSAWEGLSNALLEALACGCPVVSTDCPSGPAEVLAGGRYGSLVPVGDAGAMAAAILSALQAPADPARQQARAAEFGVARAVDAYLQVLLGGAAARQEERVGNG